MTKRGPKGPSIEINWVEFEKLCALHCTLTEISEWFSCSEDTIERHVRKHYKINFAEVLKRKSARGKISLRRQMWKKAEEGSITMQIWLSKQMLGHTDKSDSRTQLSTSSVAPQVVAYLPVNSKEAPEKA